MKANEIALFYSAAQGAMRSAGIEILDTANTVPDDVAVAVSKFEDSTETKLEAMPSAADALDEFTKFLEQYEPEKLYTLDTLMLTIPLKGGSSVTLGVKLQGSNIPAVLAGLKSEVRSLMQQNIDGETSSALTNNQPSTRSDTQGNITNGEESWPVTKIEKSYAKNGEIRLRIFGGRWLAYGVPMYPDVMEKYEFHNSLGIGTFEPPFKMKATAFVENSKPKRITKLEQIK